MTLSVAEANAVNAVLDWLVELDPMTASRAGTDAAAVLAAAAHKRLGAGWSSERFRARWLRPVPTVNESGGRR
jgi:hypothetical protein